MSRQLDIFEDGREIGLRNAVVDALLRDDAQGAAAATAALRTGFAADWSLAPAALLLEALGGEREVNPFHAVAPAHALGRHLESQVEPAAQRVLGSGAHAWMARRWSHAARRAGQLTWSPEDAAVHAAALWLRAVRWREAAAAVERIAAWRRIPQPLAWMAQARWQASGLDHAWPLLVELAWLSPSACAGLLQGGREPAVVRLLRAFEAEFEDPAKWCWFPAWALIEQPLLAGAMESAQPGRQDAPEQAFRTVLALLRLEREGRQREIVGHRRQLRGLHEGLFGCYMRLR